jgi:hypothetical protein
MAQDTSLNGLRNQFLTAIHGRRLALDPNDFLVGPKALREQVEGWNAAGSTVTSTSVATALSAWGVSLLGSSGASGTTAYTLAAPVPGVRKTLFIPTTGYAVVLTSGAGAFVCSTASVTSTYGTITFAGKGNFLELLGLTTSLWGALGPNGTSITTNVSFV